MFILVKDIFDNLGRTCNFSSCVIYKRDTETEVSQCIPYKGNRDLSVQLHKADTRSTQDIVCNVSEKAVPARKPIGIRDRAKFVK